MRKTRPWLDDACKDVDASIFIGDVLYDDKARAELKEYVARWSRAIDEHEATLPQPEPTK